MPQTPWKPAEILTIGQHPNLSLGQNREALPKIYLVLNGRTCSCIGHLTSLRQYRRCYNPISAQDQQTSDELVVEISEYDILTMAFEIKLVQLASSLLCRKQKHRFSQIEFVVRMWKDDIRRFAQTIQATRSHDMSSQPQRQDTTYATVPTASQNTGISPAHMLEQRLQSPVRAQDQPQRYQANYLPTSIRTYGPTRDHLVPAATQVITQTITPSPEPHAARTPTQRSMEMLQAPTRELVEPNRYYSNNLTFSTQAYGRTRDPSPLAYDTTYGRPAPIYGRAYEPPAPSHHRAYAPPAPAYDEPREPPPPAHGRTDNPPTSAAAPRTIPTLALSPEPRRRSERESHIPNASASTTTQAPLPEDNPVSRPPVRYSIPPAPATATDLSSLIPPFPAAPPPSNISPNRREQRRRIIAPQRPRNRALQQSNDTPPYPANPRRRLIDGECSICREDLITTTTTTTTETTNNTIITTTVTTQTNPSDDNPAIIWCRAQCGQNFHTECLGEWLGTLEGDRRYGRCPFW